MKKNFFAIVFFSVCLAPAGVLAHQPRWVETGETLTIKHPEISQAFYGILNGQPARFLVETDGPLDIYVSLLTPVAPGAADWVSAEVKDEISTLFTLEGENAEWTLFHEPFGGDDYMQGPENTFPVKAGRYTIEVFNDGNDGKFSMAVGKIESFPLAEIWNTIKLLPKLKTDFFGKPVWTAYFNYTGVFLLVMLGVLGGVIYGIFRLVRRLLK